MNRDHNPATGWQLSTALEHMLNALQLLDEADAPGEIGSYLDLAIARLEERLGIGSRLREAAERLVSGSGAGYYMKSEELLSLCRSDTAPAELTSK